MNKFKFTMPIEFRSSSTLTKDPEYVIKGYINANIPDNYKTIKNTDGKIIDVKRSIFTDKALESMRKQAKTKKIYVDIEHKIGTKFNINHYLDQAGITDEQLRNAINSQLQISEIPLVKLNDLYKDDQGRLVADTRLNPYYRELNEDSKKYFDAVWGSVKDKFINGISFTFAATDVVNEDGIEKINDVNLFGIDLTGGAAIPDNQIFEVGMRAAQEIVQQRESMEGKMSDIESKEKELKEREAELDEKARVLREREEKSKQDILEKEKKEQVDLLKSVAKEVQELKEKEQRKSIVSQENKYGQAQPTGNEDAQNAEYQERISKMLKEKVRTVNRYPNREDMFGKAPRTVNPDGEIGLGEALMLHRDYFDKYMETIPAEHRAKINAALRTNDFVHIRPEPKA